MLELAIGLSPDALSAIAALEAETVSADGGSLKLEWSTLKSRSGDNVDDVLWWEDGRLVGFLGVYVFGGSTIELSGMVHPNYRRRGIGSRLLDEAMELCRTRGHRRALLVAPRTSSGARILAESRNGFLEHSEHSMDLHGNVIEGLSDPTLTLRSAGVDDNPELTRILSDAFGRPSDLGELHSSEYSTLVAERNGDVVAVLRVHRDADVWGIYGVAVDSPHRGLGIGRDLLRRVCRQAHDAGVTHLHLDVEVNNDRALNLYTSLGFSRTSTVDYYELPLERAE